ncbi:OmpA family protein [Acinetobacter boissieri]|uniref:Outer membrane protein OmpA n=1 Tax=Acinetobacter boissieri TaxID=1219383 RepID=A0A1G6HCJ0_9GAMM|nr:OmpA family protein [Acinetobacter boissieri]SDB91992.1 Outer membrane protein OmpA [Acinetobacter boissieri]
MRALVVSTVVGALALSGCQSMNTGAGGNGSGVSQYDKTAIGTLIGAAAGYGLSRGNANSSAQNNRAAAIGAILGGAGGLYLDKKEQRLREQMAGTGVDVNRNADGSVGLVMPGNITFDTNQSTIKPNFYTTLNKVAQTLTEDNKSAILVTGYTDNTGNDSINIPLSQARAQAVASYLGSQGVPRTKINAQGNGAANPIASNATPSGREQNRRVEISIYASQ